MEIESWSIDELEHSGDRHKLLVKLLHDLDRAQQIKLWAYWESLGNNANVLSVKVNETVALLRQQRGQAVDSDDSAQMMFVRLYACFHDGKRTYWLENLSHEILQTMNKREVEVWANAMGATLLHVHG